MDESSPVQNRRDRRANVLLTATIESAGKSVPVKLRNLSAEGALVEAADLPIEGSEISFRKGDLTASGKIVWLANGRAGVHFATKLTPEALLRHVPVPRPRVLPSFRRPGIAPQPLSAAERVMEQTWGVPAPFKSPRD